MDNESILIEDPFVITNELRNRCDLFEIRHHEDRTKISQLEEENQHLRQEVDRLGEDKKRITNQLREALGIKFKKDKTPSDPPQTPVKSQPSKKRGAPLGHYGDTRSIPKIVDREEIIEAPKRCQCGSRNIAALDGYDVKFIEDLPRINRVVKTAKRSTKRKATKKKATKRKATKRKATKRKATKRKATKKKATKRKATKKKATKRKATKKKATKRKATKKKATKRKAAKRKHQSVRQQRKLPSAK